MYDHGFVQALEVLSAHFEIPLADPVVVAVVAGERGGAGPEGSTYLIEEFSNVGAIKV